MLCIWLNNFPYNTYRTQRGCHTLKKILIKYIPLAHNFHIPKYTCRTDRSPLQYADVLTLLRASEMTTRVLTNTVHCSKNLLLVTCLCKHILLHIKLTLFNDKISALGSLLLVHNRMLLDHRSDRHFSHHISYWANNKVINLYAVSYVSDITTYKLSRRGTVMTNAPKKEGTYLVSLSRFCGNGLFIKEILRWTWQLSDVQLNVVWLGLIFLNPN